MLFSSKTTWYLEPKVFVFQCALRPFWQPPMIINWRQNLFLASFPTKIPDLGASSSNLSNGLGFVAKLLATCLFPVYLAPFHRLPSLCMTTRLIASSTPLNSSKTAGSIFGPISLFQDTCFPSLLQTTLFLSHLD